MPELPEVERGRRIAESVAAGRTVSGVRCSRDPIVFDGVGPTRFRRALQGARVLAVRRRGKQLWFDTDRTPSPLFHFGMTGAFVTPARDDLQLETGPTVLNGPWPPRFTKIRLMFDDGGELAMTNARRLGRILLREDPENEPPVSRLGFDPLLDDVDPAGFSERLQRRRLALKSLLLDQSFVAGIGNWIADEVLYQAGLDPRRRADDLDASEARRLLARMRSVVRRAVDADADSSRYPRSWLFHVRWGRPEAARTARGERVEFLEIGGRTTAWAPERQT